MPSKRGDARIEHFNRGARDVPVSDKRHGVRVVRLPFQLTRERAITSPEDPTEKRGWRGGRSRFLHPLCLYNNGATFTLNGIVLAVCQATSVVPRSAGQHAPYPLHREATLASRPAPFTYPVNSDVNDRSLRSIRRFVKTVAMMRVREVTLRLFDQRPFAGSGSGPLLRSPRFPQTWKY